MGFFYIFTTRSYKYDYYPFGSLIPNRLGSSNKYRYGFNGKEKDDELKGGGNSYDFGARMYDPRIGRWFARDFLAIKYPSYSPYVFSIDSPLNVIDPDGKDIIVLAHGYRNDDLNAAHLVGHQAALIGNDKDGWYFYSYDFDHGKVGDNYTSGVRFDKLENFRNSEYNTFKDDYDIPGLKTSHKDANGKIIQRFQQAFQITTSKEQDEKMKKAASEVFNTPYSIVDGHQCTTVPEKALQAIQYYDGEDNYPGNQTYDILLSPQLYEVFKTNVIGLRSPQLYEVFKNIVIALRSLPTS